MQMMRRLVRSIALQPNDPAIGSGSSDGRSRVPPVHQRSLPQGREAGGDWHRGLTGSRGVECNLNHPE
jgi:hypothetical protein